MVLFVVKFDDIYLLFLLFLYCLCCIVVQNDVVSVIKFMYCEDLVNGLVCVVYDKGYVIWLVVWY